MKWLLVVYFLNGDTSVYGARDAISCQILFDRLSAGIPLALLPIKDADCISSSSAEHHYFVRDRKDLR